MPVAHPKSQPTEATMFSSPDSRPTSKYPFTRKDAEAVATRLLSLRGVVRIEVCGSIARVGKGNDIDLVVVVNDESVYRNFVMETMHTIWHADAYHCGPSYRKEAVKNTFGSDNYYTKVTCGIFPLIRLDAEECLDLFVMPQDWKERLDELQNDLPHDDPLFMRNIAKDAQVLVARG